jgi:hypothetical protein
MSLMWMPAQTTVPPGTHRAQRLGHQRPHRREDDARVERLRRRSSEPPAQAAPSSRAKRLRRVVAGPREGKDLSAPATRDLRDDVRRGAEAVQAQPRRASPAMRRRGSRSARRTAAARPPSSL